MKSIRLLSKKVDGVDILNRAVLADSTVDLADVRKLEVAIRDLAAFASIDDAEHAGEKNNHLLALARWVAILRASSPQS